MLPSQANARHAPSLLVCAVYTPETASVPGAGKTKPALVVVPTSTIENWCREVQRFSSLPVVKYYGSKAERQQMQADFSRPSTRKPGTVVVTSYAVAMRDAAALTRVAWQVVVVDESHRLKSTASRLKKELMAIAAAGEDPGDPVTRILLTGTPLQNDLLELWSLCNFVMPRVFSDPDSFATVYGFMALDTSQGQAQVLARQRHHSVVSKLHALLSRYLLRRTKAQVALELPSKVEVVVYCALSPLQARLSRAVLDGRLREEVTQDLRWRHEPALHGSLSCGNRPGQLRKVANHPYLFGEPPSSFGELTEGLVSASGKLRTLDVMLHQLLSEGHKVLIFSQFTRVLDLLADFLLLRREALGLPEDGYLPRIDGGQSLEQRQEAMDRFNGEGPFGAAEASRHHIALLSTRAGGMGINLTAADTVIIFDSDWNPHGDSQAEDRAHRIGQRRDVVVYRLIADCSVEVDLLRRANAKRALERIVLRDGHWQRAELDGSSSSSPKRRRSSRGAGSAPHTPSAVSAGAAEATEARRRSGRGTKRKAGSAASEGEQLGEFGALPERLLRLWLREDVRDKAGRVGGIQAAELRALLHRPLAMQAGLQQLASLQAAAHAAVGMAGHSTPTASPSSGAGAGKAAAPAHPTLKGVPVPQHLPPEGDGYTFVAHSTAGMLGELCEGGGQG